jgi:phosphoribosylanthranilate isomerase
MNTFVKICGITRPQDAELAGRLGAAAIGFVFWPGSPRYVAPDAARVIAADIPPDVMKVGVFVDEDLDAVRNVMDVVGLDVAQLHGNETPDYCRTLGRKVFKTVALGDRDVVNFTQFDTDVVLLIDARDSKRHGGTGRTVNWDSAREIAEQRPTILAGGLNAANIKLALRSVRPYGVDVSSGVESAPGVKDPARLRTFFEALHD